MHGLKNKPVILKEVIDLIHPDDLSYVILAEKKSLELMTQIGFEHSHNIKVCYSFRMKIATGKYHLFHHQAIHLVKDNLGQVSIALNIHTDIEHIKNINNQILLIQGVGTRDDYIQADLSTSLKTIDIPKFTKREKEILPLLAEGFTSKQITDKLFLSKETIRVHRKNILKKTDSKTSTQLMKKCLEWGCV